MRLNQMQVLSMSIGMGNVGMMGMGTGTSMMSMGTEMGIMDRGTDMSLVMMGMGTGMDQSL